MMARRKGKPNKPPISLSPLEPEEALAGLMQVKPEKEASMSRTTEWRSKANRRWGKKAEWISGDGQFALLAPCKGIITVTLWGTRDEAEKEKTFIDETGCGGGCTPRLHEIVDLLTQ